MPPGTTWGANPLARTICTLVLTTMQDMATAMGYGANNPQGLKNLLKLGPNEYIGLQNRSYNGNSGFTQQPWDFFAVDFDLLRNMLQGPGASRGLDKERDSARDVSRYRRQVRFCVFEEYA